MHCLRQCQPPSVARVLGAHKLSCPSRCIACPISISRACLVRMFTMHKLHACFACTPVCMSLSSYGGKDCHIWKEVIERIAECLRVMQNSPGWPWYCALFKKHSNKETKINRIARIFRRTTDPAQNSVGSSLRHGVGVAQVVDLQCLRLLPGKQRRRVSPENPVRRQLHKTLF